MLTPRRFDPTDGLAFDNAGAGGKNHLRQVMLGRCYRLGASPTKPMNTPPPLRLSRAGVFYLWVIGTSGSWQASDDL